MNEAERAGAEPLISIVCCTHNRLEFVRTHFAALRSQLGPDVELVYALDHCNDGTQAFLAEVVAECPYVRVFENDGEKGLFNCRNFGLSRSHGRYVHFLDDDDGVEGDFYALARAGLGAQAGSSPIDLYLTGLRVSQSDGVVYEQRVISDDVARRGRQIGDELHLEGDFFGDVLKGQIYFNGANTLYSRELLRRYGFRGELKKSADWLLNLEASLRSQLHFAFNPKMTAIYFVHAASMSLGPDKAGWNARVFDILLGLTPSGSPHHEAVKQSCALANFHAGYSNRHMDRARALAHYRRAFNLGMRRKATLAIAKLAMHL